MFFFPFWCFSIMLSSYHANLSFTNLTTNEQMNFGRYSYLGPSGNLFDKGGELCAWGYMLYSWVARIETQSGPRRCLSVWSSSSSSFSFSPPPPCPVANNCLVRFFPTPADPNIEEIGRLLNSDGSANPGVNII